MAVAVFFFIAAVAVFSPVAVKAVYHTLNGGFWRTSDMEQIMPGSTVKLWRKSTEIPLQ